MWGTYSYPLPVGSFDNFEHSFVVWMDLQKPFRYFSPFPEEKGCGQTSKSILKTKLKSNHFLFTRNTNRNAFNVRGFHGLHYILCPVRHGCSRTQVVTSPQYYDHSLLILDSLLDILFVEDIADHHMSRCNVS